MLKRIYIHNYRAFVNFEWRPPPVCVLVGPNGAGKSAIFEVLCLLQDLVVHGKRLEDLGFPSTLTAWRKDTEQSIEVDIELDGEQFSYRLGCRKDNGSSSITEQLSSDGDLLYRSGDGGVEIFGDQPAPEPRVKIPFSSRTSFLASLEPRPDNQRILKFKSYIDLIWYLKPDPIRLGGAAASEASWLDRDLTNFASWYRTRVQEEPDAIAALRQDLQQALPGFDQLRLQPMPGGVKDLLVRFRYGNNSHELSWDKLSDGQRMLIALYGVYRLAVPTASLVALDEIENFVAPSEIQPWLREVVDAISARNSQLIAISHHSESINYLAADSMWRMWRDHQGGHSRIALLEANRDAGEAAYEATKAEAANA
jgi:predicted ATPase